jgi:hypothetical protein
MFCTSDFDEITMFHFVITSKVLFGIQIFKKLLSVCETQMCNTVFTRSATVSRHCSPVHTLTPYILKIYFNIFLTSTVRSHKWALPSGFAGICVHFFFSLLATIPFHTYLPYLITVLLPDEEHNLRCRSLNLEVRFGIRCLSNVS